MLSIEIYCTTTLDIGFMKSMIRYEGMFSVASFYLGVMDFNSCWCFLP